MEELVLDLLAPGAVDLVPWVDGCAACSSLHRGSTARPHDWAGGVDWHFSDGHQLNITPPKEA